jgi:hypothetical protein
MELCETSLQQKSSQARADERLINFAVRIIKLSVDLPKTLAAKHIAGQILKSGTPPAPNYGEGRGAESHADFVHELWIVFEGAQRDIHMASHNQGQRAY